MKKLLLTLLLIGATFGVTWLIFYSKLSSAKEDIGIYENNRQITFDNYKTIAFDAFITEYPGNK